MLAATHAVSFLDYFRVPYRDDATARGLHSRLPLRSVVRIENGSVVRALSWPAPTLLGRPGRRRLGSITLFGRVVSDTDSAPWLDELGGEWAPIGELHDADGSLAASIRADDRGNVFLPFDPEQAIDLLLTERYRLVGRSAAVVRARRTAVRGYYAMRPFLPRGVQIALRRRMESVQSAVDFPAWPVEASLHDLYDLVLGLVARIAGRPLPYLAPWPAPYTWALVLTHDVETAEGCAALDRLREVELALGLRSAWNFVPGRYAVDDDLVRALRGEGHEVGVHGLYHDGRDLESWATLERRLPAIRAAAERWGATGFRSPALRRVLELMPLLPFDHDSSYPDTDPHGPDGGGCCSWLPYELDGLVELPVTLPQDHTLFEILELDRADLWHEKTELLRRRNAMALLITHPDYLRDDRRLDEYRRYVSRYAGDDTAWRALPREVSDWWRRRAASRVVEHGQEWRVDGPAAGDARVAFVEPPAAGRVPVVAGAAARDGRAP
jgi:peptidoglycan/xylan/chitin deacetylase (PgdA/CDA1 family)